LLLDVEVELRMTVVWVTGGAGFIGSHLAERLAQDEINEVVVIDSFTDYYSIARKRRNWQLISGMPQVRLVEADLRTCDFERLPVPEVVYHMAGQPGVRASWGPLFAQYLERNVEITERLAAYCALKCATFVFASSSSVYGLLPTGRMAVEHDCTVPHSPYGISKLAGELIVRSYSANCGLRSISLRYFTVYGPRQRPDMAIYRICDAAITGKPFTILGDGTQIREFTYVTDVVSATVGASVVASSAGPVLNVASGCGASLSQIVELVEEVSGLRVRTEKCEAAQGDVPATGAITDLAWEYLSWKPQVNLAEGIAKQLAWHRSIARETPPVIRDSVAR
jgi:UDP-glucuronate 4-epimerase